MRERLSPSTRSPMLTIENARELRGIRRGHEIELLLPVRGGQKRKPMLRGSRGAKPEAVDLARDRCVSALLPSSRRRSGRPALWAECDRALGAERSDPLVAEPNRGAPGRRRAAAVPWVTRSG